jgi:uncharacterized protein (UPF0264 family)
VARFLVSVRSAAEAAAAVQAGAALIDVKEPDRGSLGRVPWTVWREVREICPATVPVSVALGELSEWIVDPSAALPAGAWSGLAFRKLGLAGVPPDWRLRWERLRSHPSFRDGPPWIAVAYADWRTARAPDPDSVLDAAHQKSKLAGILVDTSDKGEKFRPDSAWLRWAGRVHSAGLLLALAGGLDLDAIARLEAMAPDIVAVRGAACIGGDRRADIDPGRVRRLARVVAGLPETEGDARLLAFTVQSRT